MVFEKSKNLVGQKMIKKFNLILYVVISSSIISANLIHAQENGFKLNKDEISLPVLDNHKFVVNPFTRSPFIKTYFHNSLGFGQALDLQVPIIDINGDPVVGLRGNLYFITLDFEYQYAVNDWLAVWMNFGMLSRIGDGVQTMLAQGINATTSLELGWMFRLIETKKTLLSGTINLWNSSGTIINIYDFIQRIIDEGGLSPDNRMIISRNFLQLGGGFRFAWAASDLIGINLLTEFAYGESVDRRNENELYYNFAGSLDLDLNREIEVPIGFAFGMRVNSFIAGSDTSIKNKVGAMFLKIVYTGQDDFLIGLNLIWRRMPMATLDQTLYGGSAVLNIDYFF